MAFRHLEVTARDLTRYTAREGFARQNIWAPHTRDGMCPLLDGAVDDAALLPRLAADMNASMDWFGAKPAATMAADLRAHRSRRKKAVA